jgi:hypothetical protein
LNRVVATLVRVGSDALAVLRSIVEENVDIAAVALVAYAPRPNIEQRLRLARPIEELDAAALVGAGGSPSRVSTELLRHDSEGDADRVYEVRRDDLDGKLTNAVTEAAGAGLVLGLRSRCKRVDGSVAHIPMMDFRAPVGPQGRDAVLASLRGLGLSHAVVLESGRSYHAYGWELMDPDSWVEFMARCVLLAPLTDVRYIGHRLLAGTAVLRLTSGAGKPTAPKVVALLAPGAADELQR